MELFPPPICCRYWFDDDPLSNAAEDEVTERSNDEDGGLCIPASEAVAAPAEVEDEDEVLTDRLMAECGTNALGAA